MNLKFISFNYLYAAGLSVLLYLFKHCSKQIYETFSAEKNV